MDIGLFFLGALGALLTVYLSKQEVIPEFRPMYDTSDKEIEALEHRDHIKKTENHIDELQTKLSNNSLKADFAQQLTTVLNTSLSELNAERLRQQSLEHEIKIGQVLSRGIGFVLYIVLGGVFGAFLAGRIQVEGLSGDLPDIFASIVIGATWTSYLSTIGLQTGQKKADERIQAGLIKSLEKINAVKKDIAETLAQEFKRIFEKCSDRLL
jgi:hypothetical protein